MQNDGGKLLLVRNGLCSGSVDAIGARHLIRLPKGQLAMEHMDHLVIVYRAVALFIFSSLLNGLSLILTTIHAALFLLCN